MIIAYHVIISAYGFWLPNDPRGSWSDFVRNWELFRNYGPATKVSTRQSVAHKPHDRKLREKMRHSLRYPPVVFAGQQARSVALGVGDSCCESDYGLLAFAILREHAHMVLLPHRFSIEQVVNLLKGAASKRLIRDGLHPFANQREPSGRLPQVWGRNCWKVFLYDREDVVRSIDYTNNNPVKEGMRRQHWTFVRPELIV
jgi:REP element-mobilizing transposase RayT